MIPPYDDRLRAFQYAFETNGFLIVGGYVEREIGSCVDHFLTGRDSVVGRVRIVGFATPEEYREQSRQIHNFNGTGETSPKLFPYLYKVVAE